MKSKIKTEMKNNMDIDTNVHFIAIIFKAIR